MKKAINVALFFLVLVIFSSSAYAQAGKSFNELVTEGMQYYSSGNYSAAIERFEKAEALEKNSDITYNIARSYHRMNDCENALKYYAKYQSEVVKPEDKASVEKYISELSTCRQEGKVLVLCSPANAKFKIDSETQAFECGKSYLVQAGNRRFVFEAEGLRPATRYVNVLKDKTITASVTLDGNEPVSPESFEEVSSQKPEIKAESAVVLEQERISRERNWWGLGFVIGGGASSLLGATLLGASHTKLQSNEIYSRNKGAYASGWVFTSLGVAATVTGLVFLIFDIDFSKSKRVAISPLIDVTGQSATASILLRF